MQFEPAEVDALRSAGYVVCGDGLVFAAHCRCGAHPADRSGRGHEARPVYDDAVDRVLAAMGHGRRRSA